MSAMVATGLDVLVREGFRRVKGKSIGVLCNQASIDRNLDHILDLLWPLHLSGFLRVQAVFGPQHGLFGHTQDNMIEWEGARDERSGWAVYSLYGEHREPTSVMLDGIELFLVDLQDVGARYYTFIWTMALCMRACGRLGIPVLVLDRPNPLGGIAVEGTVLDPTFSSFVGLHPLPMRHGMTIAEIGGYLAAEHEACDFDCVTMAGWRREMDFEATGLPWVMPSPNMPSAETAFVYPGACLLEATNVSEGRGTTRPFETLGAPYLDARKLCKDLSDKELSGVKFRPIEFQPTFNKFAGEHCQGIFVHVTDRITFEPVATYLAILLEFTRNPSFQWKSPPYEYEYEFVKWPIDILAGSQWLKEAVECGNPLGEIVERCRAECMTFDETRRRFLLYEGQ